MGMNSNHPRIIARRTRSRQVMVWVLVLTVLPMGLTSLFDGAVVTKSEAAAGHKKIHLVELITAVWCAPCKNADLGMEEVYRANGNDIAIIAYHPGYWTDAGTPNSTQVQFWTNKDPFGTNGSLERLALYEPVVANRGYPTVVINGNAGTQITGSDGSSVKKTADIYQEQLDLEATTTAYQMTGSEPIITAASIRFNLTVSTIVNSTADVQVHVVVIEDNLYWYGWDGLGQGSNGVDLHRFVARDIMEPLPLADLSAGHEFEVALDPWWDLDQLGYVMFLQDNDTNEVLQAAVHYPNPVTPSSSSSTPQPSLVLVMAVVMMVGWARRSRRDNRRTLVLNPPML